MAINSLSTLTEFPSLWSQNGTSVYYNSGNLGIGLSNPGFNLDVVGDINFSGDLLQNGVVMTFGQFDTDGDGTSIVYNNGGEVVLDKIRSNTLGDGVFTIRDCTNSTGKWQNRIGTDDSYNLDYYNGSSWSNCVFVDTIGLNVNATSGKRLSIRNASGISNNEDLGGVSWMQEGSTGTVVGNIFMLGDSDGGTTGRGKMFFGVRGNDSNQSAICQMSLDSFGNVNIGGNFNSSSKLYVGKTSWGINEANPLVNFAVTASGTNGSGSYTSRIMKLYSDGSFTSEVDNDDNIIGLEIEMDVTGPVNKIPLRITGDNNYNYDFTSQSNGVTPGTRLDMFVGSSDGEFSFSNTGGELLRIKGDGDVGIGTDSPSSVVDIEGSPSALTLPLQTIEKTGDYIGKDDIQELIRLVGKSNTENSGVVPSAGTALTFYNRWTGGSAYSVGRIAGRGYSGYNGGLQFDVSDNTGAGQSNFTTAMTIIPSGFIGIGTSSPNLIVSAEIPLTGHQGYGIQYNGETKAQFTVDPSTGETRIGATNSTGTYFTTLYANGSEHMRINSDGRVGLGGAPVYSFDMGGGNARNIRV